MSENLVRADAPDGGDRIIEISDLNKWFGDFHVLKDINMSVNKGEVVVVIGPSGSGKSTLIRCINRLEEHQEGAIVVDGVRLTDGQEVWRFNAAQPITASPAVAEGCLVIGTEASDGRILCFGKR